MAQYQFTTYRRPDWPPDKKAVPLLRWHHITNLVDAILHHNANNGFTGVNFIGESGTGKSTMMTTIAHRIHQQKQYAVRWFSDYDMTRLVSILDGLPKVPTLLIFDDATDSFHNLRDAEVKEIAKKLTRVRHDVQSPVIMFIAFHYSRALEKIFRNVSIRVLTSISDEEHVNYSQMFRSQEGYRLKLFERIYYDQTFKSRFSFTLSDWTGERLYYKTNEPFRCSLVAGVGKLRFILYPAESCGICADGYSRVKSKSLDATQLITMLQSAYSGQIIYQVLRQYLYANKGIDILPVTYRSVWNRVSNADKQFFVDWPAVAKAAEALLKRPRKRGYKFTKKATILKRQLDEMAKT